MAGNDSPRFVTGDAPARVWVAVNAVAVALGETDLCVLLSQVDSPVPSEWRLPAGLITIDEPLQHAARRQLERVGVAPHRMEQLQVSWQRECDFQQCTDSEPVLMISYGALMNMADWLGGPNDSLAWFPVSTLPDSVRDQAEVIAEAIARLRERLRYAPVAFELLPARFSLTQLQRLYEIVLGTPLDKRNFRKKLLATKLLVETHEVEQGVRHRAARLYRFDRVKYDRLAKDGFEFIVQ